MYVQVTKTYQIWTVHIPMNRPWNVHGKPTCANLFSVILKSKRGHSASPRNRLQNCLALHKIDKIKGYLRTVCACRYPSCSAFTWTQFYSPAPKYKIIQFKLIFWKIGLYVEKQVYLIKKKLCKCLWSIENFSVVVLQKYILLFLCIKNYSNY